jgi:hypothetical protein
MAQIKSVIPIVVLKGDAECSWMRHFRNDMRQFMTKADFMAGLNEDRFVYASLVWFQKACKNRNTGRPLSEKSVERCIKVARQLGIAGKRTSMLIDGILREGFVFKAHDCAAHRIGNKCEMSPMMSPMMSPLPIENDFQSVAHDVASESLDAIVNADVREGEENINSTFSQTDFLSNAGNTGNAESPERDCEPSLSPLDTLNRESQTLGRGRRW